MRPIDRIAYASDYSFYRMIPQAVVLPKTIEEIQALFALSHSHRIPITFRSAGTSLSGQAVTDGILVDIRKYWKKWQIEDDGRRVRVQPGVIAGHINDRLEHYGRRIGPDPSSIASATMGGILSNNSGGRSVTLSGNAYHTLVLISFVLPNGVALNMGDPEAGRVLRERCPKIANGLLELKQRIESNPVLRERIRSKYRMRNTMGYSLNAFLDFNAPHEILGHLLIGSEGTLAFISEAVLRTIPIYPLKYTGLLYFQNVEAAGGAIIPICDTNPQVMEIVDRSALRNVQELPDTPSFLGELPETAAALLVEYQCSTQQELSEVQRKAAEVCSRLRLMPESKFTEDPAQQEILWKVRKAIVPATLAKHPQGTLAFQEDVVIPLPHVADAIADLHALFERHKTYANAVIFGHASFGNIHFIFTPSFNTEDNIRNYERFMNDVVDLVVNKYDGSLKGEHGTGRKMAPFLEAEWGNEAYQIMKDLKVLVDPENLLNPGVIINPDAKANLRNLKAIPPIHPEVDKCIECGHCEWVCPSLDLTLSPRQRIVVYREITRLKDSGKNPDLLANLIANYQYDGIETCAVDGMCATACPVNIDTGDLVRRLRAEARTLKEQNFASYLSRHFSKLEGMARAALRLGHFANAMIGEKAIVALTRIIERTLHTKLPKWNAMVPRPNPWRLPWTEHQGAQVVYFPSCITRVVGTSPIPGKASIIETFLIVAERAGVKVWIPEDSIGHCCGMPFNSKGYTQAYTETLHRIIEKFWQWTEKGKVPVVIDSSSCAYTLRTCEHALSPEDYDRWSQMTILDPIEFVHDILLPCLKIHRLDQSVVLHPNCGSVKLELKDKLENIASHCATSVIIPLKFTCCAYAGDRGLLFPELTKSATRSEAEEVISHDHDGYYSTNLTCETGMSQATGKPYESIVFLVEEASR